MKSIEAGASTITTADDTTCAGAINPGANSMNESTSAKSSEPETYTGDPPPRHPAKGTTEATYGAIGVSSSAFLTLGSSYESAASPRLCVSPSPDDTVTTAIPSSRAGDTHVTVPASTRDPAIGPIVPTRQLNAEPALKEPVTTKVDPPDGCVTLGTTESTRADSTKTNTSSASFTRVGPTWSTAGVSTSTSAEETKCPTTAAEVSPNRTVTPTKPGGNRLEPKIATRAPPSTAPVAGVAAVYTASAAAPVSFCAVAVSSNWVPGTVS